MKFEIRKYSEWKEKPCENAIKETYSVIDTRSVNDPYKIWSTEEEVQKFWYGNGTNHRVENGKIKRDLEEEFYWVIEINNIEELIELQEKYGEIAINEDNYYTLHKLIVLKDM